MIWKGGVFDTVNPAFTSQECEHQENADVNAAKNILARYYKKISGQDNARSAREVSCISGQQQEPIAMATALYPSNGNFSSHSRKGVKAHN